jgi:hypothetical protein
MNRVLIKADQKVPGLILKDSIVKDVVGGYIARDLIRIRFASE